MQALCLWLFTASGFAGLIYESLWTNYLQLFLGHAAFAQTMVLIVFMGGMTLGAVLTARISPRFKNLLLGYAILECAIGLIALFFHPLFSSYQAWMYDAIFPSTHSALMIVSLQWGLSALFIFIPSLMLGATFPLMTSSLIRYFPTQSAIIIPKFYFANSLGAAIGILIAGFLLVPSLGLPGTLTLTGLLNIAIGIAVVFVIRAQALPNLPKMTKPTASQHTLYSLLIIGALLTGCASFMYEIGWIRMLTLVLGASTHAFELMVSAFVLGIALGSFWIAKRIQQIKRPIEFLGLVQICMSVLAIATLLLYNQLFEVMRFFLQALGQTTQSYGLFHLLSHLICLLLMLPATFCAGMTLPLMTHILYKKGSGEASIGKIYGANTLGAIVGTLLAIFLLMPYLGLKSVISVGALIDLGLGGLLLWVAYHRQHRRTFFAISGTASIMVLSFLLFVELDTLKMSSGVFRYRSLPQERTILFHQDGKTASVDLFQNPHNQRITLATNGKPDASIDLQGKPSLDESTQILMSMIPWSIHPTAKQVAVIGMGSSMTSEMLLASPTLTQLDTIEIEPAMIQGAKMMAHYFGTRTFTDSRSHIHIDDAKSFFAKHQQKYDLIISEPSNPWVSGISNLFSKEFYQLVNGYLDQQGLFTQWVQLYEINPKILSSIVRALGETFPYYDVYFTYRGDILLIASQSPIPAASKNAFDNPAMRASLASIDVQKVEDLQFRKLGSKQFLHPYFESLGGPVNSDYHPYIDHQAPKARFLGHHFYDLIYLKSDGLPLVRYLDPNQRNLSLQGLTQTEYFPITNKALEAQAIFRYAVEGEQLPGLSTEHQLVLDRLLVDNKVFCRHDQSYWITHWKEIMHQTLPFVTPDEMQTMWKKLEPGVCSTTKPQINHWLSFYEAFIFDDPKNLQKEGKALLELQPNQLDWHRLIGMMMLNQVRINPKQALALEILLPKDEPAPMQIQALIQLAKQALD